MLTPQNLQGLNSMARWTLSKKYKPLEVKPNRKVTIILRIVLLSNIALLGLLIYKSYNF